MGMTYGGHGGTLGPGLVFGYLAGRDAAARAVVGEAATRQAARAAAGGHRADGQPGRSSQ
jgi:hypothetical protein